MRIRGHLLLAFSLCAVVCEAAPPLRYEPAIETVHGTVTRRTFFGPPNFGEDPAHDRRETQPILLLDSAIAISAGGDFDVAEKGVREMTLVCLPGSPPLPPDGRHVQVTGAIFHAHTGHHHTALLIEVKSVASGSR